MRNCGKVYLSWNDIHFQTRAHEEELDDGTQIDVQTRISRTRGVQMFIGVYQRNGWVIAEEIYDSLPGQTMARALVSGTQRARAVATGSVTLLEIAKQA